MLFTRSIRYTARRSVWGFLLLLGCASASQANHATSELTALPQDTIVAADLVATTSTTLYDAVHEVRPDMLTGHGRGTPEVYVGAMQQPNGMARLRQLRPNQISKIIYLKPVDAERALGVHADAGVLVVTMTKE
jgi:hypothetical protein